MKNAFLKQTIFLMGLVIFILLSPGNSFADITNIEGVYIERNTSSTLESDNSNKKAIEIFNLNETQIEDGDIIVFDILGLDDYIISNKRPLKSIILLIDKIEINELPAYIESKESDLIRFRFSKQSLASENRIKLYKLPGHELKNAVIGIKIDETNTLYFNEQASIYLSEIKNRGVFGMILVGIFLLVFVLLIFIFKPLIKDSLNGVEFQESNTYYSFSKSQFAFWTLIVIASFIYIWIISGDLDAINNTALILLGITSITITSSNLINKNEEEKSRADNALRTRLVNYRIKEEGEKSNFLQDILSDATGISIHRLQALIFNLIFGVAFLQSILIDYSMPTFSETQLFLLGLSNATYVVTKNLENK